MCYCHQAKGFSPGSCLHFSLFPASLFWPCQLLLASGLCIPGLSHSQAISFWIKPAGRHILFSYLYLYEDTGNYLGLLYTLLQPILLNTLLCFKAPVLSAGGQQNKKNISYYTQWRGQALDQRVRYTVRKKLVTKRN